MNWQSFQKQYRPQMTSAARRRNAPLWDWQAYLFEPHVEEDLDELRATHAKHAWTLIDGDGHRLRVAPGWRIVDRLGYFVCEAEWADGATPFAL